MQQVSQPRGCLLACVRGQEEVGQLDFVIVGARQDPAVLHDHLALHVKVLVQDLAQFRFGGRRGQFLIASFLEDALQAVHLAAQLGRDPGVEIG